VAVKRTGHWTQPAGIGAGTVVAIALIVALIHSFLANAGTPRKPVIHQIALLKPPPPIPKPEEKPPEPEVKKEELKLPEPEPEAPKDSQNEPPPGQDLGVDSAGGAGTDGFGLVGRKGGRDLLAGGGYSAVIQRQLQDELAKNKKLKREGYRAVVTLWFSRDGRIQRFELTGSTGKSSTDDMIKLSLSEMPPLNPPPPEDYPQPIRVRVTSRGPG
jgi:protein TonB